MQNRFIIILPTRERASTLLYTLKTLMNLKYDNYKILVSDNASMDNTAEIVCRFKSERLEYVRTPERLSMSANWEFALSQIKEKDCFITFIGDDDAFLVNSLSEINSLINKHSVNAITWKKVEYCWPNHIHTELKDYLNISYQNEYALRNAEQQRGYFINFQLEYTLLPCLYNSFVRIEVLNNIRHHGNKKMFNSISPDIYSGIAISYFIDNYLYSYRPFSINGASNHSNGTTFMLDPGSELTKKFINELDIKPDTRLVIGPSISLSTSIECYNIYKYLGLRDCNIDIEKIVKHVRNELIDSYGLRYDALYKTLIELITRNDLSKEYLKDLPESKPDTKLVIKYGFDFEQQTLTLNCKDLHLNDIEEVADFVATLLIPSEKLIFKDEIRESTHLSSENSKTFLQLLRRRLVKILKWVYKISLKKFLEFLGLRISHIPSQNNFDEELFKQKLLVEKKQRYDLIKNNSWLIKLKIKTIIDIGANTGQFAEKITTIFPNIQLFCFEPILSCYNELKQNLGTYSGAQFFNFALGNENGEKEINVNVYSPSSSLLVMNKAHKEAFPFTENSLQQKIPIRKLDDVGGELNIVKPLLIKVDVQGFEMEVIKGGLETIKQADIIILETTFEELYEGQPLFHELYTFLHELGFIYKGNFEQLTHPYDGKILQADSIFIRDVDK